MGQPLRVLLLEDLDTDAELMVRELKQAGFDLVWDRVETEESLLQIHSELQDRYGRIPGSVENLFEYGRLRKLAEQMRIISIDKTTDGVAIKLAENARVAPEKLMTVLAENEGSNFSPSGILRILLDGQNPLTLGRRVLEQIRN